MPWKLEVLADRFLPPLASVPGLGAGPAQDIDQALAGKTFLAAWHLAEVQFLIKERAIDVVLADGFRLGAGLAAEKSGIPWVAYTHHFFDESGISEGMVEYYCQRFGLATETVEIFSSWWPRLREELDMPLATPSDGDLCWWNLSPVATLVLGLPELMRTAEQTPGYVHRVGPAIWSPPDGRAPAWVPSLDAGRRTVLISLSTGAVEDLEVAVATDGLVEDFNVIVTAGGKALPSALPAGLIVAGDYPHSQLLPRVDAVVCSGGHGIVTRCACLGIPVVAIPRMGDQFRVADAAAAHGLGIRLDRDVMDPARLQGAVTEALGQDPSARLRMAHAATAYDAPRRAADVVGELV
jgi:UDP:flavonoid glycosyltransferase YjiC (YdhE family)